jgi:hypothetical protein
MKTFLITNTGLKAPLSRAIQKEYNALLEAFLALPSPMRSKKCIEGTGGIISAFDLISYQRGWASLLLSWYHAGIKGTMPTMPGAGFTQWDYVGLAQYFYNCYAHDSLETQLKEWHNLVITIIEIVEHEYKKDNLERTGIWEWCRLKSEKEWPLAKWIQVNTVAPYKKARALLKKNF